MTSQPLTRVVVVLLALVVTAGSAQPARAQTTGERRCRDTIAKSVARYAKAVYKTVVACHDDRSSGSVPLSVDCNDPVQADFKGKLPRKAARFRLMVGGSKDRCGGAQALIGTQYRTCPEPAVTADDGGTTTDIDRFQEVAGCQIALVNGLIEIAAAQAMGLPGAVLGGAPSACQTTIGQGLHKLSRAFLKTRRKCQRDFDNSGVGVAYVCDDADPKRKIGRAAVRLNTSLDAECDLSAQALQDIGTCADDIAALRVCVGEGTAAPIGAALIRIAYELGVGLGTTTTTTTTVSTTTTSVSTTTTTLPACGDTAPMCDGQCPSGEFCEDIAGECVCVLGSGPCEPATMIRRSNAHLSGSPFADLSAGWAGLAHHIDVPDDTGDVVDLNCDANCENCTVRLNVEKGGPTVDNCRCAGDSRVVCDEINTADADDCGAFNNDTCTCYFTAPIPVAAGGNPVCALTLLPRQYGGTMNLRTGEWAYDMDVDAVAYLGTDQFAPCPTCDGDLVQNDGIRDGVCSGGLVGSTSCDAHGFHSTFGATSYDCPPLPAANISGEGLALAIDFQSGPTELLAAVPCDAPFGDCPCALCTGDSTIACKSDQECADAGAGTCTASGGGGIQPNACNDSICDPQTLTCQGGPADTYCDGAVHSDGSGYITCISDIDCQVLGAGRCTITQERSCYADPIQVGGSADPFRPMISAIFCVPPTSSAAINVAGGLPGPGTFAYDFTADIRCQSFPNRPYEFPAGANCTVTTTTTSTTLQLCATASVPTCAGDCPGGLACADAGGACACVPVTTTTLPTCLTDAFPTCGGTCPLGLTCNPGPGLCICS